MSPALVRVSVEVAATSASFANKWGDIRLARFGDAWTSGVLQFGQTLFSSSLAITELRSKIELNGTTLLEAAERPGTPEYEAMMEARTVYAVFERTIKEFINTWGSRLPKRRIDEFVSDIEDLGGAMHSLGQRAAVAMAASLASQNQPPVPPPSSLLT